MSLSPARSIVSNTEEFIVEDIIDKKILDSGQVQYLIKWQGYGPSECTWEPIDNLKSIMSTIEDFEAKHKKLNTAKQNNSSANANTNAKNIVNANSNINPNIKDNITAKISTDQNKNAIQTDIEGSYKANDSADEILSIKKESELQFLVNWKAQKGKKPKSSWITSSQLKNHNPEILIDYLLRKIKWPSNK